MSAEEKEQIWMNLANTILTVMKSTAVRIAVTWPYVTLAESGYWNTEVFPLRVYGSFANSLAPESERIDVCVDFKREGKVIEVIADIAREHGEVLDETPVSYISVDEGGSISRERAEEITRTIVRYIQDRWELIGRELSKTSDS